MRRWCPAHTTVAEIVGVLRNLDRLKVSGPMLLALTGLRPFTSLMTGMRAAMLKSELIRLIYDQNLHLRQRDVENIVDAILGAIVGAMAQGDRVELRDFGTFSVRQWKSRIARNPRTGVAVAVKKKVHPAFRAGKEMRARLNRSSV